MRHLIDIRDFSSEELDRLLDLADAIMADPAAYREACRYKKLATLFFEPSTRTRLSFEAAMLELGGSVLGFSEAGSSSAAKGETVSDTARIVSCYADIIAMRHPIDGAPMAASERSGVPIINAGDGGHNHPTQTLTDLLTIRREKGALDGFTIGLCGDLKYGRTVHSLIAALSMRTGIRFVLISPDELAIPDYVKTEILDANALPYRETADLEAAMPELDVLYMTRIQRERFSDPAQYERLKDSYILTMEKLRTAKPDLTILHPLPRVNEIAVEVDDDPRAKYFTQALCGKYVRMALILTLLDLAEKGEKPQPIPEVPAAGRVCRNRRCITAAEPALRQRFKQTEDGAVRCVYCDTKAE